MRTCVVCKKKVDRIQLLSFFTLGEKLVFDLANVLPIRKHYLCGDTACKTMLDKWLKRHLKRNKMRSVSSEKKRI